MGVTPSCDTHASTHAPTSERGEAYRPGQVGVRTGTMWLLVVRVGEAVTPQVFLFSRYLESVLGQGPIGRPSMVRETRLGHWMRGRRPGTGWMGSDLGFWVLLEASFRDVGREGQILGRNPES